MNKANFSLGGLHYKNDYQNTEKFLDLTILFTFVTISEKTRHIMNFS